MFNLILFDLDGTLTDSKEGIINCVKYALESFGITENDEETLFKFIGPPLYDSFRDVYGFSHEDAVFAVDKYRERFGDIGIFENEIYPNTKAALKLLKSHGKTLALATSKPYLYAERILKHFGIFEYFDYAVGANDDGSCGYKHEVIEKALDLAGGFEKSETVMVGDRENDILGAQKCGISAIGLRCGYAIGNELENAGAKYILNDILDAANFIVKQ